MARYRALKELRFEGLVVKPGQVVPPEIKWQGNSLLASLGRGKIEKISDAETAIEPGVEVAPVKGASESGLIICPHCNKQMKSQRGLSLHLKTHAAG